MVDSTVFLYLREVAGAEGAEEVVRPNPVDGCKHLPSGRSNPDPDQFSHPGGTNFKEKSDPNLDLAPR